MFTLKFIVYTREKKELLLQNDTQATICSYVYTIFSTSLMRQGVKAIA